MGYAISWLAVKDEVSGELIQRLGLEPTSETALPAEAMFTGCSLRSGWFVLVIGRSYHNFVRPESLERSSELGEVVACSIEEHVMCSSAELWRRGAQMWRVEHNSENGLLHLDASGFLPDVYPAIQKEHAERQERDGGKEADVDHIFDVPLDLAKTIVGFKHDEGDEPFAVYRQAEVDGAMKSWWKFW